MTPTLPRIAIPEPTSTDEAYNQRSLPQYIRAVEAAGGIAVPIPLHATPASWQASLIRAPLSLLPGSPADVDPARYGQERVKECAAKDEAREAVDELLLEGAFDQAKPVLGICYGLQSLNVWRHGTLIQDLPHPAPATAGMLTINLGGGAKSTPGFGDAGFAPLRLVKTDQEAREFSSIRATIKLLIGPGEALNVVARSPDDGVIEALEGADPRQL